MVQVPKIVPTTPETADMAPLCLLKYRNWDASFSEILLTKAPVITTVLPNVKYPCIVIEGQREPYKAFPEAVIPLKPILGNVISL
jgi:hypothetical protein